MRNVAGDSSEDDRISARLPRAYVFKLDEISKKTGIRKRSTLVRYAIDQCYEKVVLKKGDNNIPVPEGYCAIVIPTKDVDGTISEKILELIMAEETEEKEK